jgi:hypothetical protein
MNYPLINDVRELLEILRETGFEWVANEIHQVIKEGKAIDKPQEEKASGARNREKTETATVPFSDDEQLAIALSTIREYTSTAAQLLHNIQHEIAEPLNDDDLTIRIVSDDDTEVAVLHSGRAEELIPLTADKALRQLEDSLEETWPTSQGDYGFRIKDRERQVK